MTWTRRSSSDGVQVAGSASTCSPERMSLTWCLPSSSVNQTKGMPRRSANLICLPNFSAFAATSVAMPRLRSWAATSWAGAPAVVVGERNKHRRGHGARGLGEVLAEDAGDKPGHADGQPDAGELAVALAGQGVIAAAGADGPELLVAHQDRLHHGAGVVVESAGDAQVRDHLARGARWTAAAMTCSSSFRPSSSSSLLTPERPDLRHEGRVLGADRRPASARPAPARRWRRVRT